MNVHAFLNENYDKIFSTGEATHDQVRYMISCLVEMAKSDEREFRSRLRKLLSHMLKYEYQQAKQSKSWINTIREQSRELSEFLDEEILLNKMNDKIGQIYQKALSDAIQETGLSQSDFPEKISDSWEFNNLTDDNFIAEFLVSHAVSDQARKYLNLI